MSIKNIYTPESATIISISKETAIDWTFTIEYNKPVVSGQFLQVSLPGFGEAPISISDFTDSQLSMTIRNVGRVTNAIFDCKIGDDLYVRGPYGNGFDMQKFKGSDLIVVAGGTGLAPVRGFIKQFVQNPGFANSVHVIAGFKSKADILFSNDLREWKKAIDVIVTLDIGDLTWQGATGLVTTFIKDIPTIKSAKAKAIVVGPPMMMKFTTLALVENGMKQENITVSFERNMSCGIGKCGHCKIDSTYVCLDGPVFSYKDALHLID